MARKSTRTKKDVAARRARAHELAAAGHTIAAIAEEARREGDYKASSAALNLLSDIAGLKAPKRLEVNATIAEAPGELSVL